MRRVLACFVIVAVAIAAAYTFNRAEAEGPKKVRRAKPPEFTESGGRNVFFDDVFKDMVLNGDGTVDQAVLDAAEDALNALLK